MTVQQQVLGFEISVDDIFGVEILQRERDFCCVEFGHRIWESLRTINNSGSKNEEFAC